MPHFVYILYSEKLEKFYVGKSANPTKRLMFHNSHYNRIWSKRGQPWVMMKTIGFANSTAASKAELYIKKQKSRKLIEKIIENGWESICSRLIGKGPWFACAEKSASPTCLPPGREEERKALTAN